jgi:hypothetical protein
MADITLTPDQYNALNNGPISEDGTTIEVQSIEEQVENIITEAANNTSVGIIDRINIINEGDTMRDEKTLIIKLNDGRRLYPDLVEALQDEGFEPKAFGADGRVEFSLPE